MNKVISDVLCWTPTHGHTSLGQPESLKCISSVLDTCCSLKDQPKDIGDWYRWKDTKRVREKVKGNPCYQHDDDDDDRDDCIVENKIF